MVSQQVNEDKWDKIYSAGEWNSSYMPHAAVVSLAEEPLVNQHKPKQWIGSSVQII